jgi:hypothetical protein
MAQTSEPITFRLIVGTEGENKMVEARTAIGGTTFVGRGSSLEEAVQSLLRGTQRRLRMEEEMSAPAGYFTMWARTFYIDAPVKTGEHGSELTDQEARPIHAAITRILDEAEVEIRRKLEAIVPTYPTQPTFRLRAR